MPDAAAHVPVPTSLQVEGSGAHAVLMVHGWPDDAGLWDSTVEALKGDWRCARFTLPGFDGRRPEPTPTLDAVVETIAAAADAVSPGGPLTLLLHDWGAIFGYEFARRQPHRVARIVGVDVGDVAHPRYLASLSARAKAMVAGYQLPLVGAWKLGARGGNGITRGVARAIRCPRAPGEVTWTMNWPYALQWGGGFKGMRPFTPACPMLFVWGRRKPFMFHSPAWLDDVSATAGGQVLAMDTGHWVMVDRPAVFNRAVAAWLATTSD